MWTVQNPETEAELFRAAVQPDGRVILTLDGHEVEVSADTANEIRTFLGAAIGTARWAKPRT